MAVSFDSNVKFRIPKITAGEGNPSKVDYTYVTRQISWDINAGKGNTEGIRQSAEWINNYEYSVSHDGYFNFATNLISSPEDNDQATFMSIIRKVNADKTISYNGMAYLLSTVDAHYTMAGYRSLPLVKPLGWYFGGRVNGGSNYDFDIHANTIENSYGIPETTGGTMVISDGYVNPVFKGSTISYTGSNFYYSLIYLGGQGKSVLTCSNASTPPRTSNAMLTTESKAIPIAYSLKLKSPEYIAKYASFATVEGYIGDSFAPTAYTAMDWSEENLTNMSTYFDTRYASTGPAHPASRPSGVVATRTYIPLSVANNNVASSRAELRYFLGSCGLYVEPANTLVKIAVPVMTAMTNADDYQRCCTIKNPNPIDLVLFYTWRKQTVSAVASATSTQWACVNVSANSTVDVYITDASGTSDIYIIFLFSGTCTKATSTSTTPTAANLKAYDVYYYARSHTNANGGGTSRTHNIAKVINSFSNATGNKGSTTATHRYINTLDSDTTVLPGYYYYSTYKIDKSIGLNYSLYATGDSGGSNYY